MLKRLFWLLLSILLLAGAGFATYWYFPEYITGHGIQNKVLVQETKEEIGNAYLDTLIIDLNTSLQGIVKEVNLISENSKKETYIIAILAVITLINLLLTFVLCFLVMNLRLKLREKNQTTPKE